jgi:hypothetical protein
MQILLKREEYLNFEAAKSSVSVDVKQYRWTSPDGEIA